MVALIDDMGASVEHWLLAQYRRLPPALATDESPYAALQRELRELGERWLARWDEGATHLARWFALSSSKRSTQQLEKILRDAGIAVRFQMTPAMRDVLGATVAESVGLIKSIPRQYLLQVEGIVMRGVQTGRDAKYVSAALQKQLGVTRRRAALIARDQNNKATASFNRVRQLEAGITEAVWCHSGGGHAPRPTHLKAGRDQVRYDIARGWYDPAVGQYIQPGSLVNCRCFSRPVVVGFD